VRLRFLTALLAALALVAAAHALAQDRTVKIQVPFAPGGIKAD
jgi:tripartite-type tricarboxylate transporter receptor subunit TctC